MTEIEIGRAKRARRAYSFDDVAVVLGGVGIDLRAPPVPDVIGMTLDGARVLAVAPIPGAMVTAGFEFDVPVRFDSDRINASLAGFAAGEVPSIPVVEVRV